MDDHPDLAEFMVSPAAALFARAEAIEEELETAVRVWEVLREAHARWLLAGARRQLVEIISSKLSAPHVGEDGVATGEPQWLESHRVLQRMLERVSVLQREGPLHASVGVTQMEFRRAADRTLEDASGPYRGLAGDIDPDIFEDLLVGEAAALCVWGNALARGLVPPYGLHDRRQLVARWFRSAERLAGQVTVEGSAALAAGVGEPGSAFDVMVDALRVVGVVLEQVSSAGREVGGWFGEFRKVTSRLQVEVGAAPWLVSLPDDV